MVRTSYRLRPFAIVAALIAMLMLAAACSDGGDADAISGLSASVSAQEVEIEALSAQVGDLQTQLADAQKMEAGEVAELRAGIEDLRGQSMAPEPFDDSALQADIDETRALIGELQGRMDEDDQDDRRIDISHLDSLDGQLMELGDNLAQLTASMSGDEAELQATINELSSELGSLRTELVALRESTASAELDEALARLDWLDRALGPVYTKSYVEQAIRRYSTQGRQATLDYYNSMDSVSGDLYLFVLDANYRMIVHPTMPANIGMDIRGPLGTDITGKNYGAEFVGVDEAGKWVDYVYLNPANDFAYERKHSWIVRHEGLIFGSGWYERDISLDSTPSAYTKSLVEQAIARYESDGHDATIEYYNSPESVDGQWYVFIADENDVMIAHATIPENVGKHADEIVSPADGYPAGSQVAAAATEGGAWTTYTYLNAATGNVETKHSWVIRHDGLVFGSGWYEEGPPKSDAPAYAQSLVQRAVNLYVDLGQDGTVDYYNTPESVDGQFYTFILRAEDLRTLANGARPELVDIDPPVRIDAAGYAYGEAFAKTTDEGQWVSYVFINPETDELDSKHTWIMEHDGLLFGSGWYTDPAMYTQHLVGEAVSMYESQGLDATITYYNTPESVDGQWYVFIVDAGDSFLSHAPSPSLLGTDLKDVVGSDGFELGKEIARATEEGHWVEYLWPNPATEMEETKRSWVIRHDGLIFGSGYYGEPTG